MKPVALYYLALLDEIRACARGLGYAVGLHGSLSRDFDLIACPWTKEAVAGDVLVEAIARLVGGASRMEHVAQKPHGRKAWVIWLHDDEARRIKGTTPYIDLSVMPLTQTDSE